MMGESMKNVAQDEINSPFLYESKSLHSTSFQKLFEFVENDILCDLEIRAGSKSFKCHRVVLASVSSYFRAMFTSGLSESRQRVVNIGDIEAVVMKALIDFAYTAKIMVTCENVQAILHAASLLQLDSLMQGCCRFMENHLHPTNCLAVRQFAECHGLTNLARSANNYTLRHFPRVLSLAHDDFLSISAGHLQDLLSSSDLCVQDEIQAFEVVMQWVNQDVDNRKDLLPALLSKVRLPTLPTAYLLEEVESNELIRRSIECRDLLDQARDYKLWQADLVPLTGSPAHPNFNGERCRPRKSCSGLLFCIGGRGLSGDPFASVECFSPLRKTWFTSKSMNTKRRHVGCTYAEGKLYAVGGCNEQEHLGTAEMFDLKEDTWVLLSPMSIPRRGLGACFLGGALYAVGGLDDTTFFATVERYDISSDCWNSVASMKTPRGGVAVAALKGFLYAVGGNNGPFSLSSCEKYDPHLNKWTFIQPMGQCRAGAGAAVVDGLLYTVGGFDNNLPLSSVERYDPDKDQWTSVNPMQVPRGGVGVATLAGKLYAVGGHNGIIYLNSVEVYDPLTNRWTQLSSIQLPRAGAGVTWAPSSLAYLETLEARSNQAVLEKVANKNGGSSNANAKEELQLLSPESNNVSGGVIERSRRSTLQL